MNKQKMKKNTIIGIVIVISFISGYYISSMQYESQMERSKAISEAVTSKFGMFDAKNRYLLVSSRLRSDIDTLQRLVVIAESGKPIGFAIRDAGETLKDTVNSSSEIINGIKDNKNKIDFAKELDKARNLLKEASFYASD